MSITNQTGFYLDFQRFSDLKLGARANSDEAAAAVAQQFEGLFVQQMLAAMRSAAKIDDSQHSSYMDFYREMYDKQLAQTIAGQDRLGVAQLIKGQIPHGDRAEAGGSAAELKMPDYTLATPRPADTAAAVTPAADSPAPVPARQAAPAVGATDPAANVVLGRVVDDDFAEVARIEQVNQRWQRPQNFVADLLPEARQAAGRLGVSAELLVAQAALETGWGKHTMKFDDGRSSFNLFGIKAGAGWRGGALAKSSLEYRDGALSSEVSRFRAYASPADSLADYVDFIQSSPRYREALSHGGNDETYIRAIQGAGYATDPHYADKVIGILRGELLQNTLASLNPGVTDHA